MKKLIVVDDSRIRKRAFSAAIRKLKRLERLEEHLQAFHEKDQRLFGDWFALEFREQRLAMDRLRGEYRELAMFYNWMNAMVGMEDVSLPEAARRLREEERLYAEGGAHDRRKIEELRRLREHYIEAQLARESRKAGREKSGASDGEPGAAAEDENYGAREVVRALGRLSDDEIEDWCADPELAFLFLGDCLRAGKSGGDFTLFFRVWDLTHLKIQKQFAKDYEKRFGASLGDVLEDLRGGRGGGGLEEDPKETLKLLYRQLVRKLHPDKTGAEKFKSEGWRPAMWTRVQAAYKGRDLALLKRLFHLTLLRSRELRDLRVADLQTSQKWLEEEILETEKTVRGLRKKPAWGFSRREEFGGLSEKLSKQVAKEHMELSDQVFDLRSHIDFMERMGREAARAEGRPRSRARRPRRRSAADQLSFFD